MDSETHKNKSRNAADILFTARLIAYHRAMESERENPLIVDPYAALLAGDISSQLKGHSASRGDYSIVRAFYVESALLRPWCETREKSQVVILGAGLDTRAYRFEPLKRGRHTVFELDFEDIIRYKERVLGGESPLCRLVRVSADLEDEDWWASMMSAGFSGETPTLWISEGLAYYLQKDTFASILRRTSNASAQTSEIFADVCIPTLAEVSFGAFLKHFKWGLNASEVPAFFASAGWKVSCSFADEHDQNRDVGQRGLMFVSGVRNRPHLPEKEIGLLAVEREGAHEMGDPEYQSFARTFRRKIVPEIEAIVESYERNEEGAVTKYDNFIARTIPLVKNLIGGFRNPVSVGLISPRLLKDPTTVEIHTREEQEAHIAGYLRAILQLTYCAERGLEGGRFHDTPMQRESARTAGQGIRSIRPLIHILTNDKPADKSEADC